MKKTNVFHKGLAVVIALLIVLSTFPLSMALENEITSWTSDEIIDGKTIVRITENATVKADIPEDVIVIVESGVLTIPVETTIKVAGTVWLKSSESAVVTEVSAIETPGKIEVVKGEGDGGAFVKGNYPIFGYGDIDLKQTEDFGSEVIAPIVLLDEFSSIALQTNSDGGSVIKVSSETGEESTITLNSDFVLGTDDVLYIDDSVYFNQSSRGKIVAEEGAKIYNSSNDENMITMVNAVENAEVYHSVVWTKTENGEEIDFDVFEMKKGETLTLEAAEGKFFKTVTDNVIGETAELNANKYEVVVEKPVDVTLEKSDIEFKITFSECENGNIGVLSTDENGEEVLLKEVTVKYNSNIDFEIKPDEGYVLAGYELNEEALYSTSLKNHDKDSDNVTVTVNEIKSDITVTADFEEVFASDVEISTESADDSFFPESTHTFRAEILPSNTKIKDVVWSLETLNGEAVDSSIAEISETGVLKIGAEATSSSAFKVVATSLSKSDEDAEPVKGEKIVNASLYTNEKIEDYFEFIYNNEEAPVAYDSDKWSRTDVIAVLKSLEKEEGESYVFSFTTDGTVPAFEKSTAVSFAIAESTKSLRIRLYKLDADKNIISVADFTGLTVNIDKSVPVIEYKEIHDSEKWYASFTVNFNVGEEGSGIDRVFYTRTDDVNAESTEVIADENGKFSFSINSDTTENNSFYIWAKDVAGNISEVKVVNVKVDTVVPSAVIKVRSKVIASTLNIITFGLVKVNSSAEVDFELADKAANDLDGSGIKTIRYRFIREDESAETVEWEEINCQGENSVCPVSYEESVPVPKEEGLYAIEVEVTDGVGNKQNLVFQLITDGEDQSGLEINNSKVVWDLSIDGASVENANVIYKQNDAFEINAIAKTDKDEIISDDMLAKAVVKVSYNNGSAYDLGTLYDSTEGFVVNKATFATAYENKLLNDFAGVEFDENSDLSLKNGSYLFTVEAENLYGTTGVATIEVVVDGSEPSLEINYRDNSVNYELEKPLIIKPTVGCSGLESIELIGEDGDRIPVEANEDNEYIFVATEAKDYEFVITNKAGVEASAKFNASLVNTEAPELGVIAEHIDGENTVAYEGEWINSGYIRYTLSNNNAECFGKETFLCSENGGEWEVIAENVDEDSYVYEVPDDCEKTYVFKVIAENTNEAESEEYTVKRDTVKPVIEEIVYGNSVVDSVLQNIIYFGAKATVKVYASDELSGLGNVSLDYIQNGETVTLTEKAKSEGDRKVATFEIEYTAFDSEAFEGTLKATVYDIANNVTEKTNDGKTVVIDGIKPVITVVDKETNASPEGFIEKTVTAVITIVERNFDETNTFVKIEAIDENEVEIETLNLGNLVKAEDGIYSVEKWTHDGDVHSAEIVFNDDADYTLTVESTDFSMNAADSVESEFTIDTKAPVVNVSFEGAVHHVDNETGKKYFDTNPTLVITIDEHNFNWSEVTDEDKGTEADLEIVAIDINGDPVEMPMLGEFAKTGNTYVAKAPVKDGIYKIDVQNTDKAGNNTIAAQEFISVDTAAPVAVELEYTRQVVRSLIANLTFGVYHQDVAELVLTVEDMTSGVKTASVEYIPEGAKTGVSDSVTFEEYKDVKTGQSVYKAVFKPFEEEFRGHAKFTITDYTGNTEEITNSELAPEVQPGGDLEGETVDEVIIIDDKVPQIMDLAQSSGISNYAHYSEDKTVVIKIMENNFFAEDVTLQVVGRNNLEEKITDISDDLMPAEVTDDNPAEDLYTLVHGWERETDESGVTYNVARFTVSKEADYTVTVNYTDRSGNEADTMLLAFTIDKTAPVININYNRTPVFESEETGRKYFGDTVEATITVVEHNFKWNAETDFVITATDINSVVAETLPVLGEWNPVENAIDTYESIVTLPVSEIYTIDVQTTDKAGTNTVYETQKVVTDDVSPAEFKMTYTNSIQRSLINNLTFGLFFKDTAEVVVEMNDTVAGIKDITLKGVVESGASSVNSSFERTITFEEKADAKEGNSYYKATYVIPAQFRGTLLLQATDYSGNFHEETNTALSTEAQEGESEVVIVDNIAPVISDLEQTSGITAGAFYKEDQTVKIEVNEANFFEDEVMIKIVSADDMGKTITTLDSSLTAVQDKADTYKASQWQHTGSDVHSKSLVFNKDGDYTITVSYTDRSGNIAQEESISFTIDKTAPVISISYDKDPVFVNETTKNKYYNAATTATISITEHNFDWKNDDIKITGKDVNGNTVDVPVISGWSESTANVHTAQVAFANDGIYTYDVQTTDKAGNNTVHETEYLVVDKTAPEIVGIVFSENSETIDSFESTTFATYKYFSNGDTTVTITARDVTSGIQKIQAYGIDYSNSESGERKEFSPSQQTYEEGKGEVVFTFTLPANFKGNIYAQATDYSTNASNSGSDGGYTKSVGVVVEDATKHEETLKMEIIANVEANENGFYNADLPVTLKVDDTYSGINNLTYKVGSAEEITVDFTTGEDVTYSWTQDVTVNALRNNNNKVEVIVSYVDNAGNPHETRQVFQVDYKIDVTAPVIKVTYDNNKVINGSYFNANRIATITIEELNFNAEDVVFKITQDGKEYTAITPAASSWKHNDITHTVKIAYTYDGDYTFDIAYTDLAGNKNDGVDYANSAVPTKFTLDKTTPIIEGIAYDNNNAVNFNYFSSARTATITIREHNFVPGKAVVSVTATNDGALVSAPTASAWRKVGTDLYAATVVCSGDALYKIDVTCTDFANNKATDFPEDEFYVDNTDPQVSITGVAPQSANNGKVAPVIKVTDTNIDLGNVKVTLNGSRQGSVEPSGIIGNPHNGFTFTFDDFEKIKENDDIYTLSVVATDLAGRTNKFVAAFDANGNPVNLGDNRITFSVNRFGSTYSFSDEVEELNGKVTVKVDDIVVQEINPDKIDKHSIVIYRNGSEMIELVEGKDYSVSVSGGNGSWYTYTYRIFKENFEEEGYYSVDITSTDFAGNEAQNTTDVKDMALEFGVDATKPQINITNVEEAGIYEVSSYEVMINVTDISLKDVSIFLDGKEIKAEQNLYDYSFIVEGADSLDLANHTLKVIAVDKANNREEVVINNFTVTANKIIALLSNRVFVIVALGVILLLLILAVILILMRRRRLYDSQEQF